MTYAADRLFEEVQRSRKSRLQSYALGGIPRPSNRPEFSGVFHIHGMLDHDPQRFTDLVVTDRDFGEYYLRRRIVPDFIYDAARLFHLVLVGYSANDAPMRYLLNAVAADGVRFGDLKERFAFVGAPEPADRRLAEDWKGRGITPIIYDHSAAHKALADTLSTWVTFSPFLDGLENCDKILKRIVRTDRDVASDVARDLFDHLIRRGSITERVRIARLVSGARAGPAWLDALNAVNRERVQEGTHVAQ